MLLDAREGDGSQVRLHTCFGKTQNQNLAGKLYPIAISLCCEHYVPC